MPSLYSYQRQAIEAVVAGRDVLLQARTGGGKTEAAIGGALVRGGVTLHVGPLIALAADQKRRFDERAIPSRLWNSTVNDSDKGEMLALLRGGWRGVLITTPESLRGRELQRHLIGVVDYAFIDECHCVVRDKSFRAAYAALGKTLAKIKPAVRLACTATLPAADRSELVESLGLVNPLLISLPIARGNLHIQTCERAPYTLTRILDGHRGESVIVYVATVRTGEKLHAELTSQGRIVGLYHGRLRAKDKKAVQAAFMSDETPTMIATDAFGLGVDKPDIRCIVSYDHPKSIEDWVQQLGRAGRDGEPADVFGAFNGSTEGRESRRFLLTSTFPPISSLLAVWDYLASSPGGWRDETAAEIGTKALGPQGKYSGPTALTSLQRWGLAAVDPHPSDGRKRLYRATGNFDSADWARYEAEKADAFRRFDDLCELARPPDEQIPAAIDAYFGDTEPTP